MMEVPESHKKKIDPRILTKGSMELLHPRLVSKVKTWP